MKYKNRKKIKMYFVFNSIILHLCFLTFFLNEVHFKYTSEFEKKYITLEIYFKNF